MKNTPRILCPVCLKKHYTIIQAQACADADTKQIVAKSRRLRLINIRKSA